MKTRAISALAAIAGAAAAHAQTQGVATYHFVFNSPAALGGNGTNQITVGPGAVVNTTVLVELSPGLGQPLPPHPGVIWGIADGGMTLSGTGPTGLGSWGNLTVPIPYNFLYGLATTSGTIAGYNVTGAIWGTGAPWIVPIGLPGAITNPDNVWGGQFTASLTNAGTVSFTFTALEPTNVWVGHPPLPFGVNFQNNAGPGGSISIIPAPSGLALLGLGGLVAFRRRRG